jgi:hypothetical protein
MHVLASESEVTEKSMMSLPNPVPHTRKNSRKSVDPVKLQQKFIGDPKVDMKSSDPKLDNQGIVIFSLNTCLLFLCKYKFDI